MSHQAASRARASSPRARPRSPNGAGPLTFEIALSPEQMEALAQRVAEILFERQPAAPSAWLDAEQAAEHLATTRDRVHDLVALGKLRPARDGRRLLFRREDLDAYLEGSG